MRSNKPFVNHWEFLRKPSEVSSQHLTVIFQNIRTLRNLSRNKNDHAFRMADVLLFSECKIGSNLNINSRLPPKYSMSHKVLF